jgi:hypothetical protein
MNMARKLALVAAATGFVLAFTLLPTGGGRAIATSLDRAPRCA